MEQRLKIRIALIAILVVAAGVFFYYNFSFALASWIMVGIVLFAGFFVWNQCKVVEQRKKWLADPIPPHFYEFDAFFWKLTINQQYWYLSNICTKDDVKGLIDEYEGKIKKLWESSTDNLYDKIRDAQSLEEKVLTLMYYIDFYGDEEGDPEDID